MKEIELIKMQQEELDRRTAAENKAIELISECRFEEAQTVLSSIDDSIILEIEAEIGKLETGSEEIPRRANGATDRGNRVGL